MPKTAQIPEALPEIELDWQLAWLGDTSRMVPGFPQGDVIVEPVTGAYLVATGLWARMEATETAPVAPAPVDVAPSTDAPPEAPQAPAPAV